MTFPGPEIAIPELDGIPLALSGDPEAISVGRDLALSLSMRPFHVPGDRRLYHAAAVIAGNFATVLLAEASTLLAQAGVPEAECRALLAPLAIESIRNAVAQPNRALTGPIARGDKDVLEAHRAAFRDHELDNMLSLYEELARHAIAICKDKPQ